MKVSSTYSKTGVAHLSACCASSRPVTHPTYATLSFALASTPVIYRCRGLHPHRLRFRRLSCPKSYFRVECLEHADAAQTPKAVAAVRRMRGTTSAELCRQVTASLRSAVGLPTASCRNEKGSGHAGFLPAAPDIGGARRYLWAEVAFFAFIPAFAAAMERGYGAFAH